MESKPPTHELIQYLFKLILYFYHWEITILHHHLGEYFFRTFSKHRICKKNLKKKQALLRFANPILPHPVQKGFFISPSLRILTPQKWLFWGPGPLLYRFKPFHWRVQGFLGLVTFRILRKNLVIFLWMEAYLRFINLHDFHWFTICARAWCSVVVGFGVQVFWVGWWMKIHPKEPDAKNWVKQTALFWVGSKRWFLDS